MIKHRINLDLLLVATIRDPFRQRDSCMTVRGRDLVVRARTLQWANVVATAHLTCASSGSLGQGSCTATSPTHAVSCIASSDARVLIL